MEDRIKDLEAAVRALSLRLSRLHIRAHREPDFHRCSV